MRIVTWNTQWCCGLDGVVSPERIVEGARRLMDFDVLCLQEIAVNYPRLRGSAGDQVRRIRELLPGYHVFFGAAVQEWSLDGPQQFGNLVATRFPVAQVQHHPLPYPADAGVRSMPRMCTVVTLHDPLLGPVRVMTTHLEFYSKRQRMDQAVALRELHAQYSAQAANRPQPSSDGSPFQTKLHAGHAVLCGDFNLQPHEPEYAQVTQPGAHGRLWDAWRLLHGEAPHAPTFCLHDRTYAPEPIACDFFFVSDGLKTRVRRLAIDSETQVSDHQPVGLELG